MKKVLSIALALLMVFGIVGCQPAAPAVEAEPAPAPEAEAAPAPTAEPAPAPEAEPAPAPAVEAKTASGSAEGFEETITVTLTVEGDTIADVAVETTREEVTVGAAAIEQLPAAMLEQNTVEVDIVSGATGTSKAIISAARKAYAELTGGIDMGAWAEENGYVKASDYHINVEVDTVSGSSYQTEVEAQKPHNMMSQEQVKELAQDYLRGFVLYYELAEGSTLDVDRIYVQSTVDMFKAMNATGASYEIGDTYVGANGRIYTYSLPSAPIDVEDYKAAAQLGADTTVTDEEFVASIGEAVWSYREMYSIGTSYNNNPGLAQSECVLDTESMCIYMGSNAGSEKSLQMDANPNIKMYWYYGVNEHNYVAGGAETDNDYYHSYGVRIEGTASAISMADMIDENGNVINDAHVRGGMRFGITLKGPEEWFKACVDEDWSATCAWLAETRYYADSWATMTDAEKEKAAADVKAYMAKIYLGKYTEADINEIDVAALKEKGKDVTIANLKSTFLNGFMNRSGEGYAIRLSSTGMLRCVVPDVFLTNTLWAINDVATEEQVALYEAGHNGVMAKWAGEFYDLYTKLTEGQSGTQIRRQAYYPNQDASLDR